MKLSNFDYNLPKELIAQFPLEERDTSRLMVIERPSGKIGHKKFINILDYLHKDDAVIFNDTKVIPARLFGYWETTGTKVELLLLGKLEENKFSCLLKPAKLKKDEKVTFDSGNFWGQVLDEGSKNPRTLLFQGNAELRVLLEKYGNTPLPPYIKRAAQDLDKERYQTVYAEKEGAVAAPTAGLHFTKELLGKIKQKGVNIANVTLHVNYATFKPAREEEVEKHKMYKEYYEFPEETVNIIQKTRQRGKKILSVGTTSCRVLESVANQLPASSFQLLEEMKGYTELFIYPPYDFKLTDMLLTNFHFPKSTLLMLIAAFCGSDIWEKAYQQAIQEKYRFYSYGDAMLIV